MSGLKSPTLGDAGFDQAGIEYLAEQVARRVVEQLRAGAEVSAPAGALIDAAEVARRFGVSRGYVYDNATRLGAIRLGNGSRARLRFDPAVVAEALARTEGVSGAIPPRTPARPRRAAGAATNLLPIGGKNP